MDTTELAAAYGRPAPTTPLDVLEQLCDEVAAGRALVAMTAPDAQHRAAADALDRCAELLELARTVVDADELADRLDAIGRRDPAARHYECRCGAVCGDPRYGFPAPCPVGGYHAWRAIGGASC